jgi:hypothetical protein
VARIHIIHLFHTDKSADGNVDDNDDNGSHGANGRIAVVPDHYTLLLKGASYFIDSDTRDRVLQARRLGARNISFRPAMECSSCACRGTVTISPSDVLGFVAHDHEKSEPLGTNVVPFRVAG